uniref:Uncharacterized protein n=1 Tax=Helianthus annuus TaxID=4232 RepID=A0A251SYE9_HELAN
MKLGFREYTRNHPHTHPMEKIGLMNADVAHKEASEEVCDENERMKLGFREYTRNHPHTLPSVGKMLPLHVDR